MRKLGTALALRGSSSVFLDNVVIRGFNKGIEAVDSNLLLSGVDVRGCGVGLGLNNSYASIYRSRLSDNVVDLVVNRSTAFVIDTLAHRILEVLPRGDIRINPYQIERIARRIITTVDVREKRRLLRWLLSIIKVTPLAWTAYSIVKEALRLRGIYL
jgi:hypothetical protein